MSKVKILIFSIIALGVLALVYLKVLTIDGFCGFKPVNISKASNVIGKEWPCSCIGNISSSASGDAEMLYCSGINLSSVRFAEIISKVTNTNNQYPIDLE